MATYVEIDKEDFDRLIVLLRYVLADFPDLEKRLIVEKELDSIERRIMNERKGCAVAREIDVIIEALGKGGVV